MNNLLRHTITVPAPSPTAVFPAPTHGATVFKLGQQGFALLVCRGFDRTAEVRPFHLDVGLDAPRYASPGVALQQLPLRNAHVLIYAQQRISILQRNALLPVPDRQLLLLPGEELDPASFQDFRGTLVLLPDSVLSPLDHKLISRHPGNMRLEGGWEHLLGVYIEALDESTLFSICPDTSGYAVIQQQLLTLLRRTLLDRVGGNKDWNRFLARQKNPLERGELLFHSVCTWISDNYAMPELSSDLAAKHFGVSPRYIQNLFSRYGNGITFVSFLRKQRLRRASEMLHDPQHAHMSIAEICWNCGFSDPVYFGKIFREMFGITPGQARRKSYASAP